LINEYNNYPQIENNEPKNAFLKNGKWYVSDHITYSEIACSCSHRYGRRQCAEVDWSQIIHPYILKSFEDERAEKNKKYPGPIIINSGCRCLNHQEDLKREGYDTSSGHSTHCPIFNTKTGRWECYAIDKLIPVVNRKTMSPDLFFSLITSIHPELRLGFKIYGKTLVHEDCAFLYEGPNKSSNWVTGARW
jgi:hypothetical protein